MIHFFMGKGGVGKTTCASAFAVKLAESGRKTLIVSLDPAHNLGDVLNEELSDRPKEVVENLWAAEPDFEKVISDYLAELSEKVKDIYGYLKIFNLEGYVDTLRYSPGVEEDAVLRKISEIVREEGSYDEIVLDTPPTGLTVRMLILPTISLMWIEKLMGLRLKLLGARRALEKLTGEKMSMKVGDREIEVATEPEEDPIFRELESLKEEVSRIDSILKDPSKSSYSMVVNPDTLSVMEAKRAIDTLSKVGIKVNRLIVNKFLELAEVPPELRETVEEQRRSLELAEKIIGISEKRIIPLFPTEPKGVDALRKVGDRLA